MSVHPHPSTRREFLRAGAALGATALPLIGGCAASGRHTTAPPVLPSGWGAGFDGPSDHVALLSDVHVSGSGRGRMAENLRDTVTQVLAQRTRPQRVLVAGDCAHLRGKPTDYAEYTRLMRPLHDAGLPTHVTLGNHDHRENFWSALPGGKPDAATGLDRQALTVRGRYADWYLLDSLGRTNNGHGEVGRDQLGWLEAALDANPHRPALVMVHHDVDPSGQDRSLRDGARLFDVLRPRRQVKAVFFGHTHVYGVVTDPSGIHLVNLPATGYTLWMRSFVGWVDCRVHAEGAVLGVHALKSRDRRRSQTRVLRWRPGFVA